MNRRNFILGCVATVVTGPVFKVGRAVGKSTSMALTPEQRLATLDKPKGDYRLGFYAYATVGGAIGHVTPALIKTPLE